ncbi:MAG: hypothetical protein IT548_13535 [Alphaproteobacteria bacterium]|nr:hypothetical protein [Alphaproteobacteria bacterium]
MSVRALFHVNHLWGVGHFTRTAAIANAVVDAGGAATIIAGNKPVSGRAQDGVAVVALPVIRAPDPTYARLVDTEGAAVSGDLWDERRRLIDATLAGGRWDVLVTETFPFGRRKLARELLHLVGAAKERGMTIVSSIRDLPTAPADPRRLDECAARLHQHYDAVLVHGDPAVVGLQDVWPGEIPVPTLMSGYVVDAVPPMAGERRGVVVTGGGGGDSAALLGAALDARMTGLLADEPWTFIAGPLAPEDLPAVLRDARLPGVTVLGHAEDLPFRLTAARLAISRGGYNTVIESVAAATRTVVVPFAPEGEPEQALRAQHFAAARLVQHLPEERLSAAALAEACTAALAAPPPDPSLLQLDGAAQSASLLARLGSGV